MTFKVDSKKIAIITGILFCTLFRGIIPECAYGEKPEPIASGQSVALSYTCTLENGEIVSATNTDIVNRLQPDPFSVFIGPGLTDKVVIKVGNNYLSENQNSKDKLRDFQTVLKNEISKQIIGIHAGEVLGISIVAEDTPELLPDERFIRMAKRLIRPKKKTLSLSSFSREVAGSIPTAGKDMTRPAEPWLKGKVTAVDEASVTVIYSADVGEMVDTLYGPALVSENETQYIIDIDAVVGKLVRAGGFLGRIVTTDEDTFTIDFGNAFGDELIHCDVIAEVVTDQLNKKTGSERTAAIDFGKDEATAYDEGTIATIIDEDNATTLQGINAIKDRNTGYTEDLLAGLAVDGDLVTFDYTLFSTNGDIVMTSRRSTSNDGQFKKKETYEDNTSSEPVQTVLGRNEIVPFIENALYGMKTGGKKELHLEPKDAYGEKKLEKIKSFPRVKAIPEMIDTTREQFRKRYNVDPQQGKRIQVVPLFQSEVELVDGDHVVIKHLVEDGEVLLDEMGSTRINIEDGKITMTLLPNVGAPFITSSGEGAIVGYDDDNFVVDFNSPLAGESFFLDVIVRSIVKKAAYEKELHWETGLDEVFEDINITHKPAVLVLYASWCGWSKKLLSETLKDPRITSLSDRFLWLKVDTDKDRDVYALYEQTSYPTIVLLNNDGEVYRKMEGFTDAVKLRNALNGLI